MKKAEDDDYEKKLQNQYMKTEKENLEYRRRFSQIDDYQPTSS